MSGANLNRLKWISLQVKFFWQTEENDKRAWRYVYRRGEETVEIRSRPIFSPSLFPLSRINTTKRRYLCHSEKLGQFGHPVEECLVDLQSFFALVLLHVKVFLYRDREVRAGMKTKQRNSNNRLFGSWTAKLLDAWCPMWQKPARLCSE